MISALEPSVGDRHSGERLGAVLPGATVASTKRASSFPSRHETRERKGATQRNTRDKCEVHIRRERGAPPSACQCSICEHLRAWATAPACACVVSERFACTSASVCARASEAHGGLFERLCARARRGLASAVVPDARRVYAFLDTVLSSSHGYQTSYGHLCPHRIRGPGQSVLVNRATHPTRHSGPFLACTRTFKYHARKVRPRSASVTLKLAPRSALFTTAQR